VNISKPLSVLSDFIKRLELKKCLIISMVVALLLTTIGYFTIATPVLNFLGLKVEEPRHQNPCEILLGTWDWLNAGFVICSGPPWLALEFLQISTPFDGYWRRDFWYKEMYPSSHWSFYEYYKWSDFLKMGIAWLALLMPIMIVSHCFRRCRLSLADWFKPKMQGILGRYILPPALLAVLVTTIAFACVAYKFPEIYHPANQVNLHCDVKGTVKIVQWDALDWNCYERMSMLLELKNAMEVVCIAPAWYPLHLMRIGTIWECIWGTWQCETDFSWMTPRNWGFWSEAFRILFSWFVILVLTNYIIVKSGRFIVKLVGRARINRNTTMK
jgi:hypothetical protein